MQAHIPLALAGALLPTALAAQSYDCQQSFHCGGFFAIDEDLARQSAADARFDARLSCEATGTARAAKLSLPQGHTEGRFDFLQMSLPVTLDSTDQTALYMAMRPGTSLPTILLHFDTETLDLTTTRIAREGPTIGRFTCKEAE